MRSITLCLESWITSSENEDERKFIIEDLQRIWGNSFYDSNILPTLSTLSALDLFLTVNEYPPRSEVVMTAISTTPVISLVMLHGLVPVPCDNGLDNLSPSVADIRRCINDRTAAVLITSSFGCTVNMNPIIEMCRSFDIHVIEDCSEAFSGIDYTGNNDSDISIFSFDATKHCTAFGGALAKVKQRNKYMKMKTLQDNYPMQSRWSYAANFIQQLPETSRMRYWISKLAQLALRVLALKTQEYPDDMKHSGNLLYEIRHKPCLALLRTLSLRLGMFENSEHDVLVKKGNYVRERLPEMVRSIGSNAYYPGYWLYPILVDKPKPVVEILNGCGISASQDCINYKLVSASGTSMEEPVMAKFILEHLVYLPVHKGVSYDELDKVIFALEKAVIIKRCNKLVI